MLKERIRFILKDTAIYGIANAVSKLIVFFTLPIIVHEISPADFGIWNMLTMIGTLASAVLIFGMDSAVIRYYYDEDTLEHRRMIFSNGILLQGILIVLFLIFGFIFPDFFLRLAGVDLSYKFQLQIVFIWVPANVLAMFCLNWFKWTFQRAKFLTISIGLAFFNLVMLLMCSGMKLLDLKNILLINAVSYWMFVLIGLWWCRKFLNFSLNSSMAGKLTLLGFPMMLVMLSSSLSPSLDRLFLARYLDDSQLGIYSFCQKLSLIMSMAVMAFQTAFGPFVYSIWEKADAKRTFSRFQSYYIISTGIIAIFICSFCKPLIHLVGNDVYMESSKFYFILVLALIVSGLYSFASIGIFYSKKMSLNLLAILIGLSTTFLMNLAFIPLYREYGAVIGFLAGNIMMVIAAYFFSSAFRINFSFGKDVLLLSLLSCLLFMTNLSWNTNIYLNALLHSLLLGSVYLIAGFVLLTANEKDFVIRKIKEIIKLD